MIAQERLTGTGLLAGSQTPVTRHMRAIVWCDASAPVREVAEAVTRADQSCALVRTRQGTGIVTDRDFRSKVATARVSVEAPVGPPGPPWVSSAISWSSIPASTAAVWTSSAAASFLSRLWPGGWRSPWERSAEALLSGSVAAAAGLLSTDEAETLAGAFQDVYELLLRQEVAAIRDGRPLSNWIAPRDLDPLTRRHLRDSFRAISTVQAQLESEWKARMTPV